jgi:cyclopropane fatty-acyl-phospholipid synthase-like methyltransferase
MVARERAFRPEGQHERHVQAYYDGATRYFIRWGRGIAAIHRGLWAPGVTDAKQATETIHHLAADALRPGLEGASDPHVLDLGCGVGQTSMSLSDLLDARATGVTLSAEQVRIARQRAAALGYEDRCRFEQASYLELPDVGEAHGAIAIESFVHGDDPARFFREAARVLAPGARLIITDDVLGARAHEPGAAPVLERFCRGWRVSSLLSPDEIDGHARAAGFELEENRDLTDWIWLGRARDRALRVLSRTLGWIRPLERWSVWSSWIGGDAHQEGLEKRYLEYRFLVWRRA